MISDFEIFPLSLSVSLIRDVVINMIYVLMHNAGLYAGYIFYQSKMSLKVHVFVPVYTQSSLDMWGVNIMFYLYYFLPNFPPVHYPPIHSNFYPSITNFVCPKYEW